MANILAMRDGLIFGVGLFPGWDVQAQDTGGTTPPADPAQPDEILASKGTERIKLVLTWGTSGGEDGNVTRVVTSYSANSGTDYYVIKGGSTNGYLDLTYDTDGNWLSAAWS